jgi:hypothetical protein
MILIILSYSSISEPLILNVNMQIKIDMKTLINLLIKKVQTSAITREMLKTNYEFDLFIFG